MDMHRDTEINVSVPVGKDLALEEGVQGKPTANNVETVETVPEDKSTNV